MVEVIAHRGLWRTQSEQNSIPAITAALEAGFGVELDVRDLDGALVVSHDLPRSGALSFDALLEEACALDRAGRFAINIKADGLQPAIAPGLARLADRAFVFDASVPDLLRYQARGWPTFTRYSEFETVPALLENAIGVWVDCFVRDTHAAATLAPWWSAGKQLCFVSPELHGRDPRACWSWLRDWTKSVPSTVQAALCTDMPRQAQEYFG